MMPLSKKDLTHICKCGATGGTAGRFWMERYWGKDSKSPDGKNRMTCLRCCRTYAKGRFGGWKHEPSDNDRPIYKKESQNVT